MTEERRRSSDPLLERLFEQNADQHKENRVWLAEISRQAAQIPLIAQDVGELKRWRREEADPYIGAARQARDEATGALKLARVARPAALVIGTGAVVKFWTPVLAWLATLRP